MARGNTMAAYILQVNQYRKSDRKDRRCGTCMHHFMKIYNRRYHKCKLIGNTNGPGTDIRISYVCNKWQREDF